MNYYVCTVTLFNALTISNCMVLINGIFTIPFQNNTQAHKQASVFGNPIQMANKNSSILQVN